MADYEYDAFLSYSTAADYRFVRSLEGFLEGFHRLKTPGGDRLSPLRVCVDGSDFSMARTQRDLRGASAEEREQALEALLAEYLSRSKYLIVCCAGLSYESRWRDFELAWWLEHRGSASIFLAVTAGSDPMPDPAAFFSPRVIVEGLHERVWFDLRGHKPAMRRALRVRDFDEERLRLAAELYDTTSQALQPLWFREQRRRTRTWLAAALAVLVIVSILGVFAWLQRGRALISAEHARHQARLADDQRLVAVANEIDASLGTPVGWLDALPTALAAAAPRIDAGTNPPALGGALARVVYAATPVVEIRVPSVLNALALAGDRPLLATGDMRGKLSLWRIDSGQLDEDAQAAGGIRYVEISRRGDVVVTLGDLAQVWGTHPLATRCELRCSRSATSVQISPDGGLALVACSEQTHRVFDVRTCGEIAAFGSSSSLDPDLRLGEGSFSRDSKRVALPARDATTALEGNSSSALAFSPNDQLTIAVGERGVVTVSDTATAHVVFVVPSRSQVTYKAEWSPTGDRMLVNTDEGIARIWDMRAFAPTQSKVSLLTFSSDSRSLISSGDAGDILFWDLATRSVSARIQDAVALPFKLIPRGASVISASGEELRVSRTDGNAAVRRLRFAGRDDRLRSADLSPDGASIVVTSAQASTQLCDARTNAPCVTLATELVYPEAAFAFDGRILMWSGAREFSEGAGVDLWDAAGTRRESVIPIPGAWVEAVAMSPDRRRVAIVASHESVRTGRIVTLDQDPITELRLREPLDASGKLDFDTPKLAFSADGARLVTYGVHAEARVWDANTGALIATVRVGAAQIDGAELFDQGRKLLTHDTERHAIVWDATTGERIGMFDDVDIAHVTPDGKTLVTASGRRVRFFDLDERAVFAEGCHLLAGLRDVPSLTAEALTSLRRVCVGR